MNAIPQHLAIIMDGNGRWAKLRGRPRIFGHKEGVKATRETVRICTELNVPYLTLYTFSTENWTRPQREVNFLMNLMAEMVDKEIPEMMEKNVRLRIVGDMDMLPKKGRKKLEQGMEKTLHNTGMNLCLAISYGGRRELVHSARKLAQQVKEGEIELEDITEESISSNLYLPDVPDVDLMIRTGGEYRTSNFLVWQAAYSELFFTPVLWPDFGETQLQEAIHFFGSRQRRFGGVLEEAGKE